MLKNVMKIAVAGALMMGAATTAAHANATAQPGETVGLAVGAPLPEGVYFVNTLDWGVRNTNPDTKLLVDIPVIAWSTPWSIFGGNLQLIAAAPMIHIDNSRGIDDPRGGGVSNYGFYNPFAAARIAFDLGGGFGVSYLSGFYFNAGERAIRVPATTWRQDFAVSYTGDGWNLTANLLWGITFGTSDYTGLDKTKNGFNLDLTATKTFGKWEFGAVGFGSTEYDRPDELRGTQKTKQFAVGPLVGYNFGPVILQAYVTRDVYARGTGGNNNRAKDTRAWFRAIIPLWTPATPAAPLVTKY